MFTPSFHTLPASRWWLRPINWLICKAVDRVVSLTRLEADLVPPGILGAGEEAKSYRLGGHSAGAAQWEGELR